MITFFFFCSVMPLGRRHTKMKTNNNMPCANMQYIKGRQCIPKLSDIRHWTRLGVFNMNSPLCARAACWTCVLCGRGVTECRLGWKEGPRGTDLQLGLCGQTANGLRNYLSMSGRKREIEEEEGPLCSEQRFPLSNFKLTAGPSWACVFVLSFPLLPCPHFHAFFSCSSCRLRLRTNTLTKKQSPTIPLPI